MSDTENEMENMETENMETENAEIMSDEELDPNYKGELADGVKVDNRDNDADEGDADEGDDVDGDMELMEDPEPNDEDDEEAFEDFDEALEDEDEALEDDEESGKPSKFTETEIVEAIRRQNRVGHPELAAEIRRHVEAGTNPPIHLIVPDTAVRAERAVPADLEAPPKRGPGATQAAWAEFALQVSTIEPEVVAKMSRDDIISLMEMKKIINKKKG